MIFVITKVVKAISGSLMAAFWKKD